VKRVFAVVRQSTPSLFMVAFNTAPLMNALLLHIDVSLEKQAGSVILIACSSAMVFT
jgi:hypothetical protein